MNFHCCLLGCRVTQVCILVYHAYLVSGATLTNALTLATPQKLLYGKTELKGMKLSPLLHEVRFNHIDNPDLAFHKTQKL